MVPDAVLSAFMQVLFEKLSSAVLDQLKPPTSIHNMFENLTATLLALQAFLHDAEAKQLSDSSIKAWLAKLKDVFYDVDDLLDDYYARVLLLKSKGQQSPGILQRKVHVQIPRSQWQGHLYRYKMEHKIHFIQQKLYKIARERDVLGLQMFSTRPEVVGDDLVALRISNLAL